MPRCFCGRTVEGKDEYCFQCMRSIDETIKGYDKEEAEERWGAVMKPGANADAIIDCPFIPDLPRSHSTSSSSTIPPTVKKVLKGETSPSLKEKVIAIAEEEIAAS